MAAIRGGKGEGIEFYPGWNRYELRSVDQDIDVHEDNERPTRTDDIRVGFFPE